MTENTDNPRQYRNPNPGTPGIRVDLKDGRIAVVGDDWRSLPLDHHNEAVRSGCEVDTGTGRYSASDEAEPRQGKAAPSAGSDDAVRTRVLEMLNRDEPDDFVEATGKPNLKVLSGLCGFTVEQSQASRVLKGLQAEAQAEKEEEDRVQAEMAAASAAAAEAAADPEAVEAAQAAAAKKVAERQARAKKALKQVAKKTGKPGKTAESA